MGTYITSRPHGLADTRAELSGQIWFSMWQKQLWPYNELAPGDILWWYDSDRARLRWKSRVTRVEAFPYTRLDQALDHLDRLFGVTIDRGQDYLTGKPPHGYCLGYQVKALNQVDVARPDELRFSRTGWERGDRNGMRERLRSAE